MKRFLFIIFFIALPVWLNCGRPKEKGPSVEEIQQIFWHSPEEELKPTRWDTGDTTVTNEDRLELFLPAVEGLGGGYFGVGSIQNFILAAWARSEYIWLMDFTKIVVAANRIHIAFMKNAPTKEEYRALWQLDSAVKANEIIEKEYGNREDIAFIKQAYKTSGPYLRNSLKNFDKLVARRKFATYLSDQSQYEYIRSLALQNRIRPLKGDLTVGTTVTGIAEAAKKMGITFRIIYFSNAEEYFGSYPAGFRNAFVQMPVDDKTLLVRTIAFRRDKFRWAADSELSTDRGFHYNLMPFQLFQQKIDPALPGKIDVRDLFQEAVIDPRDYGISYIGYTPSDKPFAERIR